MDNFYELMKTFCKANGQLNSTKIERINRILSGFDGFSNRLYIKCGKIVQKTENSFCVTRDMIENVVLQLKIHRKDIWNLTLSTLKHYSVLSSPILRNITCGW